MCRLRIATGVFNCQVITAINPRSGHVLTQMARWNPRTTVAVEFNVQPPVNILLQGFKTLPSESALATASLARTSRTLHAAVHVQPLSTVLIHCVSLRCAAALCCHSLRWTAVCAVCCVALCFMAVVHAAGPIMESRVPVEQPKGDGAQHRHTRHRHTAHVRLLVTPKATVRVHVLCWGCGRHS